MAEDSTSLADSTHTGTAVPARLLDGVAPQLRELARDANAVAPFMEALTAMALTEPHIVDGSPALTHICLQHLPAALDALAIDGDLALDIRAVVSQLNWTGYPEPGPSWIRNMCWAEIVGRTGSVRSTTLRLGLFLLAPGLCYPLHAHDDDEVYLVLSGETDFEQDFLGQTTRVTAPGLWLTPSRGAHALHTASTPALLLYIHVGVLDGDLWWWQRDGQGHWRRTSEVPITYVRCS
jgi:quercetin dioxygenase-like cupin family protein